jgi:hypothetical protein
MATRPAIFKWRQTDPVLIIYRSALYPPMRQLDRSLARWAERKYKQLRGHLRRATHWVARISSRRGRWKGETPDTSQGRPYGLPRQRPTLPAGSGKSCLRLRSFRGTSDGDHASNVPRTRVLGNVSEMRIFLSDRPLLRASREGQRGDPAVSAQMPYIVAVRAIFL